MGVELGLVHGDGHDDLFHGGVASALAQAVDGALNLRGAVAHTLHGQGGGHAEVVVAVNGDGDVLDALDVVAEVLDALAEVPGHVVAGGVGDVDDRGASGDHGLDHAGQVLEGGAAGVLCVELDVLDIGARMLDGMDAAIDGLVEGHAAELVLEVLGADADAGVDAGAGAVLERVGADVDVLLDRAGQAADNGLVAHDLGDLLDGLEVAGARDGETGLDDVNAQTEELTGDDQLLLGVHGRAGALFAVAQGGVEDVDLASHDDLPRYAAWRCHPTRRTPLPCGPGAAPALWAGAPEPPSWGAPAATSCGGAGRGFGVATPSCESVRCWFEVYGLVLSSKRRFKPMI